MTSACLIIFNFTLSLTNYVQVNSETTLLQKGEEEVMLTCNPIQNKILTNNFVRKSCLAYAPKTQE
ncbi:CLUMA_CG014868, isoform A [Clunio marinus]|uniref:CLUMA_CG014868, isoform A n=1 Tax=Clunio marinus TaxID=568069 RepID=A0A1J1IN43_9DIPT|nr:CLUMA_CG014868, isoform A [Clunio marinus]